MSVNVSGKVVLVSGGNRGIGRAVVEEALNRGARKVYVAVRRLESVDELVAQHGDRIVPLHFDLTDPDSITAAAQTASDVEVVVNNAGVLKTASPLDDHAIESFEFEMNANAYGLIRVAQAFAPVLKANGGGGLVQLNSVASMLSFADFATYSASKAASYSITQALREKLREQNTLVVSVHPGPIQTDMARDAGLGEIAEPPSLVADSIFDSLADGRFHAWPDTMANQIGGAYRSFAEAVIETEVAESAT